MRIEVRAEIDRRGRVALLHAHRHAGIRQRLGEQIVEAEVGALDVAGIESLGHGKFPGRLERLEEFVRLEDVLAGELGPAHFPANVRRQHQTRPHQVLGAPEIGEHVEGNELRRQERAIVPHFLDARIDAGNEGAGNALDPRVEALPLRVERTAIEEEPGSLVEGNEARAKHLGKPAKLATPEDVELPQPQRRGGVALAKEGIVHAAGGDVRNAPAIDGDIERRDEPAHGGLPCLAARRGADQHGRQQDDGQQGRLETAHPPLGMIQHIA